MAGMMTRTTTGAVVLMAGLALAGCASSQQVQGPQRVSPDDRINSRGLDRLEMDEAADELTRRMLNSGFLDRYVRQAQVVENGQVYTYPEPARMVVSEIENLSDIPRFPKEIVATRVRTRLLESGKVQFVSFFGKDGTDEYATGIQDDLREQFKELDESSLPAGKSLQAPRLSLRTQIQYATATNGQLRQNDYQIRMFVSDMQTGVVVWEGVSEPVSKVEATSW